MSVQTLQRMLVRGLVRKLGQPAHLLRPEQRGLLVQGLVLRLLVWLGDAGPTEV